MKMSNIRYISATAAKNRFGEVIREVYGEEHHLIVQRDGIPVVAIVSMQEYERLVDAQSSGPDDQEDRQNEKTKNGHGANQPLMPLIELSDQELAALAKAVVSPERQTQLTTALAKNRNPLLSTEERLSLDDLLDNLLTEIDQVALLKARALYTLRLRHSGTEKVA